MTKNLAKRSHLKHTGCLLFFCFLLIYFFLHLPRSLTTRIFELRSFHRVVHLDYDLLGLGQLPKSLPEWCRCFVSGLTQWRITDARGLMDCVYSTKTERCTRARTHSFDHSTPFSRIRMISLGSSPSKVNFSLATEAAEFLFSDNENGLNWNLDI